MKRSSSAPSLVTTEESVKRAKLDEEAKTGSSSRNYLQMALDRVLELQRQVEENTYESDRTSDIGESDSEEDVMREVLKKVFKSLPGSSVPVDRIIDRALETRNPQLDVVRGKSIQLNGYDTCRQIAVNFMKNVVRSTSEADNNAQVALRQRIAANSRRFDQLAMPAVNHANRYSASDYEIRSRMLLGLDIHLAAKQRDYIAGLMRQ